MVSMEAVERVLPIPIYLRLCCNPQIFFSAVRGGATTILKEHNSTRVEPVECLLRRFVEPGNPDNYMEYNDYEIVIGNEVVLKGKGPDITEPTDKHILFYQSLLEVIRGVLDGWHDRIIELQKINEAKIEELRYEGQFAILYKYYEVRRNKKALFYLKKLAELYPDSVYVRKLRRVYSMGMYGKDSLKPELAKKIPVKYDEDCIPM